MSTKKAYSYLSKVMIVAEIRILKKIFVDCDTDIIIEIDMGGGGGRDSQP